MNQESQYLKEWCIYIEYYDELVPSSKKLVNSLILYPSTVIFYKKLIFFTFWSWYFNFFLANKVENILLSFNNNNNKIKIIRMMRTKYNKIEVKEMQNANTWIFSLNAETIFKESATNTGRIFASFWLKKQRISS